MADNQINIHFTGGAESLFDRVKAMVDKYNGSLSGNANKGEIAVSIPVMGKIAGIYNVQGDNCTINITQKPFILSNMQIKTFLEGQL